MNEKFEVIMNQLIEKRNDFLLNVLLLICILIGGVLLHYQFEDPNILSITFVFLFLSLLFIPIKIKTINKHKWILKNYQIKTEECIRVLYAYKHNLNGPSILTYFILRLINQEKIILYQEAINLLKKIEVKDERKI